MKCVIVGSFVSCAGSLSLAVVLGAQTGTPSSSRAPDTYDPSKTTTVAGCLKPGAKDGDFLLADAADPKASAGAKSSYSLIGVVPPGVRLKNHVNHKVEVSGAIGEATGQTVKTLNMHTFKMVSEKCS